MVNSDPLSWLTWALFLAGAPLLAGIVNKLKARLSGRFGPTVFQPYYELLRLARKETVYSTSAGFITRLARIIPLAKARWEGVVGPTGDSKDPTEVAP